MVRPPTDIAQGGKTPDVRWRVDLQLTVWSADDGWHARLDGTDTPPREFASPFELARYLAWPVAQTAPPNGGIR